MKDHFGDDAMGRKRAWTFLPWHFQFLTRYCPYPEEKYAIQSTEKPLIQSRVICTSDDPLELLLANKSPDAHDTIAAILWDSDSNAVAIRKLQTFAESPEFKQIILTGGTAVEEDEVLANKPPGREGKWNKRQVRKPGPKRTEEEIAAIRAQRAKKKEMIIAMGGEWPPN
jgi:hypothetical protein